MLFLIVLIPIEKCYFVIVLLIRVNVIQNVENSRYFDYLLAMLGFFIKKSFFDGWDNFFQIILQNLIYIALLLLSLTGVYFFGNNIILFYSVIALFLLLFSLSLGGTSEVVKNYADYKSDTWSVYIKGVRRHIKHSLFFFLVILLLAFMVLFTIPFYSSFESVIGLVLCVVLFWVFIFFLLALPYYFPLMTLFPLDGAFKTMKKAFMVSFDNPGKSVFLLLHIIFDFLFSILSIGLVPGVTGIMLSSSVMMKLLMKKYDYLVDNPDKTKKDIDWDELLREEKECVGVRTLKGMIFPWK